MELVQVYLTPNCRDDGNSNLPSELVFFRRKSALLVVTKSWCSAANSTGLISTEQCLKTGQTISFMKDLGKALNGTYTTPSYKGIEASIAMVHTEKNLHQHDLTAAAAARQMVVSDQVNVFAASDLPHSTALFRCARQNVSRAAVRDEVDRIRNLDEGERNEQDALTLAKAQLKIEQGHRRNAAKRIAAGFEAPVTRKKPPVSWNQHYNQLTAYKRTHGHLPKSGSARDLYKWAWKQVQTLKKSKNPKQERIDRLREIGYNFDS
jgi:hypothetical protein